MWLFLIVSSVCLGQEVRISQERSTYFEYNKFNNSLFYAQSEFIGGNIMELELGTGNVFPTDFWEIDPAMFNLSYKCIYEVHTDTSAIWYLRDFQTGEDSALVVFTFVSQNKFLPDPYYSISPNDKRMMYVAGWGVELETGELFYPPENFEAMGYDTPFVWKNDETVLYISSKNEISEYNIEIGKVFDVLEVDLEDGDEILTLDFNSIYKLIALTIGKEYHKPQVYIFSMDNQQLRSIPNFPPHLGLKIETRQLAWSPNGEILAAANYDYFNSHSDFAIYEHLLDKVTIIRGVTSAIEDLTWLNDESLAYLNDEEEDIYTNNISDYITSVKGSEDTKFNLSVKAFPNPFNSQVEIIFTSKNLNEYAISIYNSIGELIYTNEIVAKSGKTRISWNGQNNQSEILSSGVYYCILRDRSSNTSKALKLLLLK